MPQKAGMMLLFARNLLGEKRKMLDNQWITKHL